MATETTQFKILRYAIIPFHQRQLLAEPLPEPKGLVVLSTIEPGGGPKVFEYRNKKFALTGFRSIVDEDLGISRYLVGRLAKHKELSVRELTEFDLAERIADDWNPIWIIIDMLEQYIAVEVSSAFGTLQHIRSVIELALTKDAESQYAHEIIVSGVSHSKRFWDIIEAYPHIYKVRLTFISPNVSNTARLTKDTLETWKDIFNPTKINLDLTNKHGELKINPKDLEDPINYISEGEGDWTVVASDRRGEPGFRFKSSDDIDGFEIEAPPASKAIREHELTERVEGSILARLIKYVTPRPKPRQDIDDEESR